jgi:hypothetical protein
MICLLPHDSTGRGKVKLRWSSWVLLNASLLVAVLLPPAMSPDAHAFQAGSGSVTARVFVCPDALSLDAVLASDDPSALLAYCDPSTDPNIAPRLR